MMMRTCRKSLKNERSEERMPLHARVQLTTLDGKPVAPLGRCTNVSLGGIRVTAAQGVAPATPLQIELCLPSGRIFQARGRVAWLKTTLRPSLLGTPTGRDDDADFGLLFEGISTDALVPIANLFIARQAECRRAQRIRRLVHSPIHA
jgi:hypothetical protein